MKIIDEKGMLFGKINVIDFLVFFFLFCFIPIFFVAYKIISKKPAIVQENEINPRLEIEVICRIIKLEPQLAQLISVGDKEYDTNGTLIGEVTELGEIRPYVHELDIKIKNDKKIMKEDTNLKQIIARFRLNPKIKEIYYLYYKTTRVLINTPLEFETNKYKAIIVPLYVATESIGMLDIKSIETQETKLIEAKRIELIEAQEIEPAPDKKFEEKYLDLSVILKDLDKETLALIAKGDKETDKDGQVTAEILSVGQMGNSTFMLDLGGNNFILAEDPYKKQISVKMRLKCRIRENNVYFKDTKIESNSPFEINTEKYEAKGIVSQSYEVPALAIKEKWISLQVKFIGVIPEVARIVNEGDTEKEPSGKTIGALKTIVSNKPSDILTLSNNKFITVSHPFQKEIIVLLDLLCIEKEGVLYFKNYPVKMGNMVTFTTDLYSISGTITGMKGS